MNNITKKVIRREVQYQLEREMDRSIISTVIGPRQVGKTTLLEQLAGSLEKGGVPPRRVIFVNFDDLELRSRLTEKPGELTREVEIRLGVPLSSLSEKVYLFLDEAQKAPLLFDEVKLLYDRYRDKIKFVITGSSSLEIRKRMAETLAGRIRYHYLTGITLKEALVHHGLWSGGDSPLTLLLKGEFTGEAVRMAQAELWEDRGGIETIYRRLLLFGSLPEVFLEEAEEERWFLLRDYAATYIEKDIRLLSQVGDLDLFHRLYQALILQNGNLLNISNLATDLGMSRNTINSYLGVMEQTLVIERLRPWLMRRKTRLLKSPKIYFFDSGLVNHAARRTEYGLSREKGVWGAIAEGVFLGNARSVSRNMSVPPDIYFWRDYQGHEIDFVIEGKETYGVEITTEDRRRKKRFNAIEYVRENAGVRLFLIVGSFPALEKQTAGSTVIYTVPYWLMF